jgi:hypothetical protein
LKGLFRVSCSGGRGDLSWHEFDVGGGVDIPPINLSFLGNFFSAWFWFENLITIFLVLFTSSPMVSYSNDVASVVVRLSLSSISKARFGATGAISMKLGVRIPLGNTPRAFFDFRSLNYFVVYRRPSWKSHFCHLRLRANGCS